MNGRIIISERRADMTAVALPVIVSCGRKTDKCVCIWSVGVGSDALGCSSDTLAMCESRVIV